MLSSDDYAKSTDELMSDLKRDLEGKRDENACQRASDVQMQGEINPEDLFKNCYADSRPQP
jgi:hypothetical protein